MRRSAAFAFALSLLPGAAMAQTLNGTAEWTVTRGANESDGQPYDNNSFWQRYAVDFASSLIDPRLLKYNANVSFRTSDLQFGDPAQTHQGHQRDLGYMLGAALFPNRPFPLLVQASRTTVGESGEYPSSSGIRGGIAIPSGEPLPDFETRTRSLNIAWRLTEPKLPRVELGYRTSNATVSGGPYQAAQNDADLQAGLYKDGTRVHQSFRFQRTSTESLLSQAFDHRLSTIDYDLSAMLSTRSRVTVRAGRRSTYSLFDIPGQLVDPGAGNYRLAARGDVTSLYTVTGINYQPSTRLMLDLTGSAERESSSAASLNATLATASAQSQIFRGLWLSATGEYGDRGQIVADVPVTVITRNGRAGATYRAGIRWLEGSVGFTRGIGSNAALDGRTGAVNSWSEEAALSTSFRGLMLGGGFDRQRSVDEILDFGNYDTRRWRASAQELVHAVSVSATLEDAFVERGRGATFASNRQRVFTASASYTLPRDGRVTASAGSFRNVGEFGRDVTQFIGGAYDRNVGRRLHLSAWVRREYTVATQTRLDQRSLAGLAQLEYRLRLLVFAVEYRKNDQDLRYGDVVRPYEFRGQQVLFRVARKFGVRF